MNRKENMDIVAGFFFLAFLFMTAVALCNITDHRDDLKERREWVAEQLEVRPDQIIFHNGAYYILTPGNLPKSVDTK